MPRLIFDPTARDNSAMYREGDPALWRAIQQVLAAIEAGAPTARETPLRLNSGTAWQVTVRVLGRDQDYVVIWALIGDTDEAYVAHVGPRP